VIKIRFHWTLLVFYTILVGGVILNSWAVYNSLTLVSLCSWVVIFMAIRFHDKARDAMRERKEND
jgi:hypothetical protein